MILEVSSPEHWKILNYNDGLMYCSMIEIGGHNDWRMMTYDEWMLYYGFVRLDIEKMNVNNKYKVVSSWYVLTDDEEEYCSDSDMGWAVPVRDLGGLLDNK